ncbi:transposase [Sorangium cellulosum So ce56]|uniref:Transposase n=1 Tax=Sorangium cellulosum (strain So ce56) TaxID=448385 RepID=A9GG21_SORC5|nr:IS66 family insertion sequence element accessory protein TnpB [Sorangium cellulosum]CAN96265.1 transposase [Sorangium cellulosum So ce56]
MIPAGVQVFVALEPVDMRSGFERLSGLIRECVGYEARCGALFAFIGKRWTTIKIIFFDGSGLCLFSKRLHRGTFALPDPPAECATHVEVDDATHETLLDGIEIAPTRNAWLFFGSDDHASAAANLFSLAASCKVHHLDPEAYLADVIRVMPYWPRERYPELAPRYWARSRARLVAEEMKLPLGPITVPPPLAAEEQRATS